MSLQYCSITQEPLQEAVVSKKSGHIFEKRIIEKHIQATGTCPITDVPLDTSDLVEVKLNNQVKPRPSNATSIPNMINIMQNEWDIVMLESYNLKQHLETVRQELSHALYQHDASCRVIARVIRERDEARKELSDLYAKLGVNPNQEGNNGMVVEQQEGGLNSEVCKEIEESALKLNKQRKQNKKDKEFQNSFQTPDVISQFGPVNTVSLHSTTKPGITCVRIHPELDIIGTGGNDGSVIIYDKVAEKILHQFETSQKKNKKVNDITFANFDQKIRIFAAVEDGHVFGFEYDLETKQAETVYQQKYPQNVTSIDTLPLNFIVASACSDGTFSFHDARANKEIATIKEYANTLSFSQIKIHPDGHFAALATFDGKIIIWNVFQNSLVAELSHDTTDPINSLGFSENGYILASASKQGNCVKIWDLRKSVCVKTISENISNPECVQFDFSALLLSITGEKQIKLINAKNYEPLSTTEAHTDTVTAISFAQKSKYFVTVSQDRNLIIHSN